MKRIFMIVALLILVSSIFGQPYKGPFGLKMGLTLAQLKAIDPNLEKMDNTMPMYRMTNVPTPHRSFEWYVVIVSGETGLCKIMAVGKDIATNSSGSSLISEYNSVRDAIATKYGEYTEYDYLMSGSIWYDSEDFMMGLVQKDRTLSVYWTPETGATLSNNLSTVWLNVQASNQNTGYFHLHYEFTNFAQYHADVQEKENRAF